MKNDTHGGAAVAPRNGHPTPHSPLSTSESPATFGKLQFHPLVMAFPRLSDAQIEEMADEIRMRGAAAPILKRGEIVLDDYSRTVACEKAGVEIRFKEWDGAGSLAEVVTRAILPRTHLTESQRAAIAVPVSDQLAAETVPVRNRTLIPNARYSRTLTDEDAPKTAFSESSLDAAKLQHPENAKSCSTVLGNNGHRINGAATGRHGNPAGLEPAPPHPPLTPASPTPHSPLFTPDSPDEKRMGRAAEIAAELCSVSPRYVYEARKLRDVNRDLFEMVRKGQMNLSKARVAVSRMSRASALSTGNSALRSPSAAGADDVIVGDCLEKMAKLADGIFPLIFADPPYNLGWAYDADPTKDLLPDGKYLEWTERWIRHCVRLLTPDGSIFVMIDSKWQGRFDVILRNAGLHWRNTIVWHDTFPTHTDARFQPAARFIHYFSRSEKKFTFNADAIRVPSRRDAIADGRRVHEKGIVPHDVWGGGGGGGEDISRIQGNNPARVPFDDAPPQVPEKILERIILAASNAGDRVFDPFTGNGTTWRAARKLGRKFTGIERSPLYAAQARQWAMG